MFTSKFAPIMLVALIGVVLMVVLAYLRKTHEGFEGPVPTINQTSAIPEATAAATTSNPTESKPASKDVEAALEALKNYKMLAASKDPLLTDLPVQVRNEMAMVRPMLPQFENRLQASLTNPDAAQMTLKDVTDLRTKFENYTNKLRDAITTQGVKAQAERAKESAFKKQMDEIDQPTTVAGPVGVITLKELQNLRARIQAEIKRLAGLRSKNPTLVARQQQLEKLGADVFDIISAVERKSMSLDEVPITPQDASRFLLLLQSGKPLTTLIVPKPKVPKAIEAKGTPFPGMTPDIQKLLEQAQYMKFELEVKLQYDPKLAMQERLLKNVNSMEKNLTALAVSETPIPDGVHKAYTKELQDIKLLLQAHDAKTTHGAPSSVAGPHQRLPTTYGRDATLPIAENPSKAQIAAAQGAKSGPAGRFPDGEISPDVYIRPGFVMNDETIARRASASAFDERAVGGADYKKRAQDLCKQIQGAQLGEPSSFGCIGNPDEVSANYSWRGNFQMVCNRLGDTWGGWYPEMFGCPKYDPTAKFKGNMM